jgi:Ca2+-binding RTX toxin-like protein
MCTPTGGQDRLDGGNGNDHLRGDDFDPAETIYPPDDDADILRGGNDVLGGIAGDDLLEGDVIFAGLRNDLITGGADRLSAATPTTRCRATSSTAAPTPPGRSGSDQLYGGIGDDKLIGDTFTAIEG